MAKESVRRWSWELALLQANIKNVVLQYWEFFVIMRLLNLRINRTLCFLKFLGNYMALKLIILGFNLETLRNTGV